MICQRMSPKRQFDILQVIADDCFLCRGKNIITSHLRQAVNANLAHNIYFVLIQFSKCPNN